MKKKNSDFLTWVFLIFAFIMMIYFIIHLFFVYSQIEQLEGIYQYTCQNGTLINFTNESPAFLCDNIRLPNPLLPINESLELDLKNLETIKWN